MRCLIINLINFNSADLAGAGYFFKRINTHINWENESKLTFDNVIVLYNKNIDPVKVFNFQSSANVRFVKVPFSTNFLSRIIVEQFFLPFWLLTKKGVFFSPTPAIPLLSKFINNRLHLIPVIHDMIPFHIKNKYTFLRSVYVKFISKYAAKLSHRIITVSEYSKKDIASISKVDINKIDVVYNFVSSEIKVLSDHDNYFVTVCTIEPGKNIETMVRGFKAFIDKNPQYQHYKYIIAGKFGWNYETILTLVNDLQLANNVVFTGYLTEEKKNKLLEKCIGMLYLSRYEGFGIPPLEAMSYGKPSVVSNTSSLPEVVGNAGIIQDPDNYQLFAENLKKLIDNSGGYISNMPSQFAKFSPEAQVNKFKTIIINNFASF